MNFLDRRNKMAILQERANLYNQVQDELFDKEVPEEEHLKSVQQHLDQHTQQQTVVQIIPNQNQFSKTLPKPPVSVLTTSALISLGLDNYGTMTTQQQDFNRVAEDNYNHFKKLKQDGNLREILEPLQKQKQDDAKTQGILFKADHLKEYEDQTHQGYKDMKSRQRRDHNYNDGMNQMCINMGTKNHLMKNDLNTFFNQYLKHKSTLRGAQKQVVQRVK